MGAGRKLAGNPLKLGDFHPGYFVDFPHILVAYFNLLQYLRFLQVRELEARLKESETRLREAGKVNERLGQEATRREILLKRTQLKLQALPQVINYYSLERPSMMNGIFTSCFVKYYKFFKLVYVSWTASQILQYPINVFMIR
jgi:hypothetical protein